MYRYRLQRLYSHCTHNFIMQFAVQQYTGLVEQFRFFNRILKSLFESIPFLGRIPRKNENLDSDNHL